jgi:tetratricopeptide (TPR) repeat protein
LRGAAVRGVGALALLGALSVSGRPADTARANASFEQGLAAFESRQWLPAMASFLEVLRIDPAHAQAHTYVAAITKELRLESRMAVERGRIAMLESAAERAGGEKGGAAVRRALDETVHAESRMRDQQRSAKLEEAKMQKDLGHLLAATDLVLQVLAEDSSDAPALRALSDLQSSTRMSLDHSERLSVPERYALEGFYAYGQASYAEALTAWQKARAVLVQGRPETEAAALLAPLHFQAYEAVAQAHVEETQHLIELKNAFQKGLALYESRHYAEALETFRALAIREPEYPHLAYYLIQAESAAEKDRTKRLGERKRQEIAERLQQGLGALEKEQYARAQQLFQEALRMDPSHPQARAYLAMASAELKKRNDPKAAQMHYEAGLIAYASGKLDEAVREWRMATRSDPHHEKAALALNKVQKELALAREGP